MIRIPEAVEMDVVRVLQPDEQRRKERNVRRHQARLRDAERVHEVADDLGEAT